jgi:hypothetical protein
VAGENAGGSEPMRLGIVGGIAGLAGPAALIRPTFPGSLTNRPQFAGVHAVQTRGVRSLPLAEVAIASIFGDRSLGSLNPFLAPA